MTVEAHEWWPPGLADRPSIRARIDAAAAEWSAAWLVHARLQIARWDLVDGDVWSGFGADGRLFRKTLGASAHPRALNRILERVVDVDLTARPPGEADRRVLDILADRAIEDLLTRLEAALVTATGSASRRGPAAAQGGRGGVHVGLGEADGGVLVWLALPMGVLGPACRATLPPARLVTEIPASRSQAIAGEQVALEAVLGAVHLALAELRTLSCGDVLILDRALDAPADLVVARTSTSVARARLIEADGRMALDLQSSPA